MPSSYNYKKLLTIDDPHKETIYDIVGRMEVLLEIFKENKKYHKLIPFLYTYLLVTKTVAEKYSANSRYFNDIKALEYLDVYFASLYFKPLLEYLSNDSRNKPWKTYFDYISGDNNVPFLDILLGINSHINSDLYTAIKHTDYKNQKDFFKVNDILLEVTPGIMKFLIRERDLVGIGSVFLKTFIENEFHLVIEKWRSEVWAKSISSSKLDPTNNDKTERIGNELITLVTSFYRLHPSKVNIQKINELSII